MSSPGENPKLKTLFQSVLQQMSTDLSKFSDELANTVQPNYAAAHNVAHRLHGAAAPYGYPCLSELGAELEQMVSALRTGTVKPTPAVAKLIAIAAETMVKIEDEKAYIDKIELLAWKCECLRRGGGVKFDPVER